MIEQFDTSAVMARERLAYYHDVICRLYCHVDLPSFENAEDVFRARVTQKPIATIGVGDIAAPGLQYVRTTTDLSRTPSDEFLASLLVQGSASLEQSGRQTKQNVGDIVLYDTARAFKYNFSSDYRIILLKIPRRQMLCRLSDAERMTAIALNGQSTMGALAGAVIRGAANVDAELEPCAASKLAASIIDIFAAAVETEFRDTKGALERHGDVLQRAKTYIEANLGDSELDVEMVSNAIGVSRRTLNRIFAAHGTTAARWLWQKRLEASHTSLTEGRSQHIADVAVACGFSDFSHFSRAFKKTYGVAPNTLVKRRVA
ncbi:helix-turn-helix domain-containing protein [Paraburkholderia hospita]|uniref:AraC family transcriptional regulator n=1 Tax=Paraburkholderia hospita TaxID=169430 RepID=A0AAN1JLM7_9BURK|nr:helix-turn-helix domain-containing protein [Paraburkholderia hospita]AUT76250.1 AraC family transcriptional regulator [Paraburkholderia hospita]SEI17708.1 AraC-binding-like domain-containing protein [Paraburkholderia hospita]